MTNLRKLNKNEFPESLLEIPDPPKQLYIRGALPNDAHVYLGIVGSRGATNYGKAACERLIEGLAGYPIAVVSGLAIGMDAIAHKKALQVGLPTVAVPGSGLDPKVLYPASNALLGEQIVQAGGALISEFEPSVKSAIWTFPRRNRIMAGLCRAVLIVEAQEKSGTLITARLALDYNRDVLAVPGSIFSDQSTGTNKLIQGGATPILESTDILRALGFKIEEKKKTDEEVFADCSPEEIDILKLLTEPTSRDDLIREIERATNETQATLSMMEIKGLVKEEGGLIYRT